MTSTTNSKPTTTTKRPAVQAKPAVEATVVDKNVEAVPAEPASAGSQHIADQIKAFPRRRVWPD